MHPFFDPHGSKNSLRFSAHFCGLEKIGANNAPKKLPTAIFACPSFANKIISAALKLSAKMVFALRTNQRAICPRAAQTKKRELITPSCAY